MTATPRKPGPEPDHLLSPIIAVHCFWHPRCTLVIHDRPEAAHAAMEGHYEEDHREAIDRITGKLPACPARGARLATGRAGGRA